MDDELVLVQQIQETEGAIASTLSRCEKMVDDELMDLVSGMTKRPIEGMLKSVVSRVVEKLHALLHQEPTALVGVGEEVEWIEREVLRGIEYGDSHEFTLELGDVAYDLEDALDNLLFKSEAQESRKGKLSAPPALSSMDFSPLDPAHDSEEIIEGGRALLAEKALDPKMKKKARQIQDKFRLMDGFLKDSESGGLQSRGMVWKMEELLAISSPAVDVMEELISRREETKRSARAWGFIAMGNLKSQHRVAMKMEQICSKILSLKKEAGWLNQTAFPSRAKPWSAELPEDEEENIEIKKMSLDGLIKRWGDVGDMTTSVASRAIEKLTALLVQEPVALIGVEEQVQWIQNKLRHVVAFRHFTEEAIDVAYEVENYIDYLVLISASKARSREDVIASNDNQLHKKLEGIMYKIQALPPPAFQFCMSARAPITEIDWLQLSSVLDQNMAKTVVSPVIEKVTALLAQGSLPPRLKKSARRVEDKFKLMNDFVKNLESEELNDRGMAWMEELCRASLSTVDASDQFMKSSRQQGKGSCVGPLGRDVLGFAHLISQHKLSRKMDQIYAKIRGLSIRRPERAYGHSNQRTVLPSNSSPNPEDRNQEPDIVSFSDDVNAIMRRLLANDSSFSVISIVGMPGIGKTTLAKLIYNNKAIVDHFSFRAWTSATDWDELSNDLMGEHIDHNVPRSWKRVDSMRQKLNPFLTGEKYLIVLDDAYSVAFLDELVRTLPDESNGSKMILTSSTMRVASQLEKGSVHHVRLRGDDESWALFTQALKVNISPKIQKLKREIVRRCGGLPLAIVKLADALSQKDETSALQQLNQEEQQLWSYTLSRINDDLPLYMQRCLYYFSLFPQDFEIPARRLIMLWVAEGLVKTEGENEAPEDVAERYLIALIGKGMVRVTKNKLNGNIKTCVLPDALRQYWSSKALQATFLQVAGTIRRLADHLEKEDVSFHHIHGDHKTASTSLQLLYREVVSFLSFDSREGSKPGEDVRNFLHRCISSSCLLLLRVLDLENIFKPKLPEEIGKLTQLRYLGLRSTFLDAFPSSVNKLESLQVFDIKHTNISNLPSLIWNMQELRQLYLNDRSHIKLMPQSSVGSSSSPLQVLVGLFVDEETLVKDGLDRFLDLRKLGLTCFLLPSSQQEAVAGWISKLKDLQSLRLKSINEENQPWGLYLKPLTSHINLSCLYLLGNLKNPSMVSEFPHSLIELTLSGSKLEEDPMQTLDKLPNLKVLRLLAKSFTGKKMVCSSGGFPQLQVLKLWKLEQLEEWNVDEGAMEALWDLDIRSCKRLKMIPEVLHRRALLELKLTDMPQSVCYME